MFEVCIPGAEEGEAVFFVGFGVAEADGDADGDVVGGDVGGVEDAGAVEFLSHAGGALDEAVAFFEGGFVFPVFAEVAFGGGGADGDGVLAHVVVEDFFEGVLEFGVAGGGVVEVAVFPGVLFTDELFGMGFVEGIQEFVAGFAGEAVAGGDGFVELRGLGGVGPGDEVFEVFAVAGGDEAAEFGEGAAAASAVGGVSGQALEAVEEAKETGAGGEGADFFGEGSACGEQVAPDPAEGEGVFVGHGGGGFGGGVEELGVSGVVEFAGEPVAGAEGGGGEGLGEEFGPALGRGGADRFEDDAGEVVFFDGGEEVGGVGEAGEGLGEVRGGVGGVGEFAMEGGDGGEEDECGDGIGVGGAADEFGAEVGGELRLRLCAGVEVAEVFEYEVGLGAGGVGGVEAGEEGLGIVGGFCSEGEGGLAAG